MKKAVLFILSLIIYMFFSILLEKLFEAIQNSLFRSSSDLLFMHSKYTNAIIAVGLIICFGVFWVLFINKSTFKKYYILLLIFVITLSVAFVDMFSFSTIGSERIIIKENIAQKSKQYTWKEVNSASVDYSYGKDKSGEKYVTFEYYITLNDGNKVYFRNSEEFRSYDKVKSITEFIKSKGININRTNLSSEDLNLLVSNYEDEYGENTEKMFIELYNIVN